MVFCTLCHYDLYIFWEVFREKTRFARPSRPPPSPLLPASVLARYQPPPRLAAVQVGDVVQVTFSFITRQPSVAGHGGKKSATRRWFEEAAAGWWWGGRLAEHKKELARAPASSDPGVLDYSCQKIAASADGSSLLATCFRVLHVKRPHMPVLWIPGSM